MSNLKNVLYIDLTKKTYKIVEREDLFDEYIGGSGVAIKLLSEECPEGIDPYSPENPIIFAVGPLNGVFPLASKTVAMFKSPHTGDLGESHCGGRTSTAIRLAGYGAIVIKGKSDIPIYLSIHDGKVFFKNATTLWGIGNISTVGRVIREQEGGSGFRTIMRIGIAGENLVSYASVAAESFRHFGRLGLGAVFGSKNLKAIVIYGNESVKVYDTKAYRELYNEIYDKSVNSPLMKKYHDLGTPMNVLPLNEMTALPTRNLQNSRFEGAETMSGEYFLEHLLGRRVACTHCPVACIHIAALREPYEDEPYFYKTSMISYDYEPIYALGTMLGISNAEGFLKLMDTVEELGLDAMSTGVVLAWATEAYEKGLISDVETLGVKLSFGDYVSYIKAVYHIVRRSNDFYMALGKGADFAASIYGGSEFALTYNKNEMAGYHTGPASHLGLALGARHSHLDNAGYSIDQKVLTKQNLSPNELANLIIEEESWRNVLSSLVICFFAREIYTKEVVKKSLEVANLHFSEDDIMNIGKKIYANKYKFKLREGFSFENLKFPKRIFETQTQFGNLDSDYMKETLRMAKDIILKLIES
ncbi:MAG: aldehyde ferredoxin oxidoreductase family protein [Nitrososphaeria archaeon]